MNTMNTMKKTGRLIGVLVLVQFAGGILVNFFLTAPMFGSPGFMENGALYAQQIGLSVLLGLVTSGLTVAMAVSTFPIFRKFSPAMALWFVVLSAVGLSVSVVENIGMMSLVSFSEAYAVAAAAEQHMLETVRTLASSLRNWAHYINLIISGCTIMLLYLVFYRFSLIPRLLAGFGLFAVGLQLASVSRPLFGYDVSFKMLAPLALCQLALAVWLIVKGFKQNEHLSSKESQQ
jgi:hypothetical protein